MRQSPSRPGGIARSRNTPERRLSPALPSARTPPPSPAPLLPRGPAGLGAPGGLPRGRAGAASRSRPLAFRRAAFLRSSGSSLSPTPASQRSFAGFGRYGRLQLYPQNPSVRLPECADGCIGRSRSGGSVDRIRSAERLGTGFVPPCLFPLGAAPTELQAPSPRPGGGGGGQPVPAAPGPGWGLQAAGRGHRWREANDS